MVIEKPDDYLSHVVFASHSGLAEQIQIISSYIRFYHLFCFEKIPSSSYPGFLVGFFFTLFISSAHPAVPETWTVLGQLCPEPGWSP